MTRFTAIDLSQITPPDIVETVDFEDILYELQEDYKARYPQFTASLESDPVIKLLEVFSYREVLLRQRVNDASKAVMLATSTGADLDNLAVLYGVQRHVLQVADLDAEPPVEAELESDVDFRRRTQLALEAFSTAGPQGAYIFHGLSAHAKVKDVVALGHSSGLDELKPAQVKLVVLSHDGNGATRSDILEIVKTAVSKDDVRPLADEVFVESAQIVPFAVEVELEVLPGPSGQLALQKAHNRVSAYVESRQKIGRRIDLYHIGACFSIEGVENIDVIYPVADIEIGLKQAPWCDYINISSKLWGGNYE